VPEGTSDHGFGPLGYPLSTIPFFLNCSSPVIVIARRRSVRFSECVISSPVPVQVYLSAKSFPGACLPDSRPSLRFGLSLISDCRASRPFLALEGRYRFLRSCCFPSLPGLSHLFVKPFRVGIFPTRDFGYPTPHP